MISVRWKSGLRRLVVLALAMMLGATWGLVAATSPAHAGAIWNAVPVAQAQAAQATAANVATENIGLALVAGPNAQRVLRTKRMFLGRHLMGGKVGYCVDYLKAAASGVWGNVAYLPGGNVVVGRQAVYMVNTYGPAATTGNRAAELHSALYILVGNGNFIQDYQKPGTGYRAQMEKKYPGAGARINSLVAAAKQDYDQSIRVNKSGDVLVGGTAAIRVNLNSKITPSRGIGYVPVTFTLLNPGSAQVLSASKGTNAKGEAALTFKRLGTAIPKFKVEVKRSNVYALLSSAANTRQRLLSNLGRMSLSYTVTFNECPPETEVRLVCDCTVAGASSVTRRNPNTTPEVLSVWSGSKQLTYTPVASGTTKTLNFVAPKGARLDVYVQSANAAGQPVGNKRFSQAFAVWH